MDESQSKALLALQPFLHLATSTKNPSHRFLADLVTRAISATGTYVFTELLQTPAIQSLRAADTPAEYQVYLTVLEIFAWGTYEEYKSTPNLPALTDTQAQKLRLLSLLSIASPFLPVTDINPQTNNLTYDSLLKSLSLSSPAELESLVTTAIYSNLLTARLSPATEPPTVYITSVTPLRDLRPQSLPAILRILQTWESRCTSVINDLETQIATIKTTAAERDTTSKKRQQVVDTAVLATPASDLETMAADARAAGYDLARPHASQRSGSKRDLEQQMDGEADDFSDEDSRSMEVDDFPSETPGGIMPPSQIAASRGSQSGKGNKRNRGRG